MREMSEDNRFQLFYEGSSSEFGLLLQDENKRYTINGEVLDAKGKVAYDLMSIRIHMIDFGFDEFDSESFQYIKDEIDRCRRDLDEDKVLEAAIRIVCMQLLLGLDINMTTLIKSISMNKLSLPDEFYGEVPQKMLRNLINYNDEQKRLPEFFKKNPDDDSLKKKRGK